MLCRASIPKPIFYISYSPPFVIVSVIFFSVSNYFLFITSINSGDNFYTFFPIWIILSSSYYNFEAVFSSLICMEICSRPFANDCCKVIYFKFSLNSFFYSFIIALYSYSAYFYYILIYYSSTFFYYAIS